MRGCFMVGIVALLGACGAVQATPDAGSAAGGGAGDGGGPSDAGGAADAGSTDAGLDCEGVAVVPCVDACGQFQFGNGRASNQPVTARLLIKGPEACLEASVTGPAGPSTGRLRRSNSLGEWEVEFVANLPGEWTVVVSRRGQPALNATYRYSARPGPAVVVAPCWRAPRPCQRLFSSGGLVACDEMLFALDGGLVGELPDGGFFLGGTRFASASGGIFPVTVRPGGVTLGSGVPFPAPTAWAVEGRSVLVATATEGRLLRLHDDGGLGEVSSATPPGPTPSAFFLGEDHPVLAVTGQRLCDVTGTCASDPLSFTPLSFHAADGQSVFFKWVHFTGILGNRVEFRDGGFVPFVAGNGSNAGGSLAFQGWIPPRGLHREEEGFFVHSRQDRAFAVDGGLRFGASLDATWATTATESLVFCE